MTESFSQSKGRPQGRPFYCAEQGTASFKQKPYDVPSLATTMEATVMVDLKKSPNVRRSTSGKYMDIVLEKQMSGFYLALRSTNTVKGSASTKPIVKKQAVGPNKSK